ncbi:MAG: hypothetical protein GX880_01525 [Methanomicrobiales archaeon]|nr:hypothetical protein [Methanomicrobiales archaeon]
MTAFDRRARRERRVMMLQVSCDPFVLITPFVLGLLCAHRRSRPDRSLKDPSRVGTYPGVRPARVDAG